MSIVSVSPSLRCLASAGTFRDLPQVHRSERTGMGPYECVDTHIICFLRPIHLLPIQAFPLITSASSDGSVWKKDGDFSAVAYRVEPASVVRIFVEETILGTSRVHFRTSLRETLAVYRRSPDEH
jgi:hypothetical protein